MCDPVSASIALTVAGTAAQSAGQAKARKAMEGAQQAERIRQKGFQDESNAAFNESLGHADSASQASEQSKAEGERQAAYDQAAAQARAPIEATGQNLAGDTSGNKVIASENAMRSANASNYANQQAAAKAALKGFNDVQIGNALYNNRQLQRQGTIGNFMQGSSAVLPYEVHAASRKGDKLKGIGDVLSLAGAVTGLGAGAGWWGGADTAAKTAGTIGTASGNASNAAMFGSNSADLALRPSASMLGSNLSSQYANALSLNPAVVQPSSFFNFGSLTSGVPLTSVASRYIPIP